MDSKALPKYGFNLYPKLSTRLDFKKPKSPHVYFWKTEWQWFDMSTKFCFFSSTRWNGTVQRISGNAVCAPAIHSTQNQTRDQHGNNYSSILRITSRNEALQCYPQSAPLSTRDRRLYINFTSRNERSIECILGRKLEWRGMKRV